MQLATLRAYAKKDDSPRPKFIGLLAAATIIFAIVALGGYAFLQVEIQRLDQVETEIDEIQDFIAQTDLKARQYHDKVRFGAKPVARNAIDQVQADMLQKMRHYGLTFQEATLQSGATRPAAAAVTDKAPNLPGVEYQTVILGPWESSINYLRDIQEGPALLNIRSIHSEATIDNPTVIRTTVKYKIFTEKAGAEI